MTIRKQTDDQPWSQDVQPVELEAAEDVQPVQPEAAKGLAQPPTPVAGVVYANPGPPSAASSEEDGV